MVDGIGADGAVGIQAQNIVYRARGRAARRWIVAHGLVQEERDVFSQILEHAIRGLVGIDPVSRSNDGLSGMRNGPGQPEPGRESQGSRSQQAIVPPNSRGGNNKDRRILCGGDGRERALCGSQIRRVPGNYERGAARRREINVRCLVRGGDQVAVVFVTQPNFQFEIGCQLPAILDVEMSPIRMGTLRALADANLRLTRNSEQKVSEGISTPPGCRSGGRWKGSRRAVECICSARVIWERRVEVQMEKIPAELDRMLAAMN